MKILIVSDSHGDTAALRKVIELEKPDRLFHLGDVTADPGRVAGAYPELPMEVVAGNCDAWSGTDAPDQRIVTAERVKFLLVHGHKHWVKMGTSMVVQAGQSAGVDVVCFGHTHKALCRQQDGLWVVNPGTLGGVNAPATYAVAEAADGTVFIEIRKL